ncbi:trigger factor [Candidatus Aerophobetes bacterium]|nr:trigger factor [Candidatus Aerophobetes bacterium]
MQIKLKKKEGAQLTFEVEVPKEEVNNLFSQAFKKLVKEVEIPGFRKGKVPRKIFEQKFGKEVIQEEALKDLYPMVYREILEKEKITPLLHPKLEVKKFAEEEKAEAEVIVITKPEVELTNYKGIKVKSKKIKVEKEEIEKNLENIQKHFAEFPPLIENRPTQEGDWLSLEITPLSEGTLFPEGQKENLWYKLGSDQLPPSFHKALLGAKIGDQKVVETFIPADHPQKEFAGRKINFNVKVKEIRKEKLPELNDELAKKLNFENLDALKAYIEEEIKKLKEKREEERIKMELLDKVVKNSKVDIPQLLVEELLKEKIEELEKELKEKRIDKSSFLKEQNLTEEELNKRLKKQIELELKMMFVIEKIAEEEKIKVSDEEIEERLSQMLKGQGKQIDIKKIREELARQGRLDSLIQRIRNEKTIDFIYQSAEIS